MIEKTYNATIDISKEFSKSLRIWVEKRNNIMKEIFSKEELKIKLSIIRRITKMSDSDAIVEIREFLLKELKEYERKLESAAYRDPENEKQELYNCLLTEAKDTIKYYKEVFNQYDNEASDKSVEGLIRAQWIEECIKRCEREWTKEVKETLKEEFNKLKKICAPLIIKLKTKHYIDKLIYIKDGPSSPNALKRFAIEMKEMRDYFISIDRYSSEIKDQCHKIMERRASARAKKKIMALQVAKELDEEKKVVKYRKEADLILKQDWHIVLPNEQPPSVD